MHQELELCDMDTDDINDFDNQRDEWQDGLIGEGLVLPSPEGMFLLCASIVAFLFVVVLVLVEAWRILWHG